VSAPRCPACRAEGPQRGAAVSAERIAAAWARQDAFRGVAPAEVARRVRAELGADGAAFLRCRRCGVERADPARTWSAEHYPPESYGIAWDHLRALERLEREPPLRLLEVGCAEGAFLARAQAAGHRATGIDFSAAAVGRARAAGLDAHVGDVGEVARFAAGERFGAVAMFQVIEHLEAPDGVFEALSAVAAPGALLFAGCPAPERYTRRLPHPDRLGDSDFWDWPPQHVLRWTPEGLRIFLRRHGWRTERVEAEPFDAVGAAAHLAAVAGIAGGWYGRGLRRRAATAAYRALLAARRLRGGMTGIRMLAVARREGG
jgi:SAM-dependent methyltransferase